MSAMHDQAGENSLASKKAKHGNLASIGAGCLFMWFALFTVTMAAWVAWFAARDAAKAIAEIWR